MAGKYSVVYMNHILLMHSFVDGHLGWFHYLAVVNSVTINIGVHISIYVLILILLGVYLE
jgi:hypothetical protein